MSEEQTKKQEIKEESAEEELLKNELTEDELNGVSGGDGGNWNGNGSLKEEFEFTDDELKSVSGGKGVTEQSVNNWIDERIHFLDPSA